MFGGSLTRSWCPGPESHQSTVPNEKFSIYVIACKKYRHIYRNNKFCVVLRPIRPSRLDKHRRSQMPWYSLGYASFIACKCDSRISWRLQVKNYWFPIIFRDKVSALNRRGYSPWPAHLRFTNKFVVLSWYFLLTPAPRQRLTGRKKMSSQTSGELGAPVFPIHRRPGASGSPPTRAVLPTCGMARSGEKIANRFLCRYTTDSSARLLMPYCGRFLSV